MQLIADCNHTLRYSTIADDFRDRRLATGDSRGMLLYMYYHPLTFSCAASDQPLFGLLMVPSINRMAFVRSFGVEHSPQHILGWREDTLPNVKTTDAQLLT